MTQNSGFLFGYANIIANGAIVLVTILNILVYKFRQQEEAEVTKKKSYLLSLSIRQLCYCFSFEEIKLATSNFHDTLVIGKGGFGNVYKGTLAVRDTPTVVAIKRLKSMSKQGSTEFLAEIQMLAKLRHSHLVSLIGFCDEGYEMILVYEFMPGGTLADHLYKRVRRGDTTLPRLSWVQRLKICIGAARGLDYLHTGTGIQHRIIHRDVKTTNILLDENYAAKISDFGLSKTSPANQAVTYVSTHVKGTFGYLDPYYYQTLRLTWRSDVYSFGIVLLEVLCGRPAVDRTLEEEQIALAGWAQHCFGEDIIGQIIDPRMKEEACSDSVEVLVKVAIQCIDIRPKHRPTMAEVVVCLESALALQIKSTEYFLPEIIPSDDDQEERDISDFFKESENYETGKDDIAKIRHQEKPSALKRFVALLAVTAQTISANIEPKTTRNNGVAAMLKSSKLKSYTFKDLSVATRRFHPDSVLGEGDSGPVYKGWVDENTLAAANWGTGTAIAVKTYRNEAPEVHKWLKEIIYARKPCHPNIVKVIGYCSNKEHRLLVQEYMPRGSLDTHLFRRDSDFQPLSWKLRISIALGAARALACLHSPETNLIHRDVKTSNILIDSNYNAKLSGFGFARDGASHEEVCLDPELFRTGGHLTLKSDVYSFGVVLLEIFTGQKAFDMDDGSPFINHAILGKSFRSEDTWEDTWADVLPHINHASLGESLSSEDTWAESRLSKEHVISDIMDADIKGQYTEGAAVKAFSLVLKSTSYYSISRPHAKQVVEELEQLLALVNLEDIKSTASPSTGRN